jgi:hypothetical protein
MGFVNNRVVEGSVIVLIKQIDVLETICSNIIRIMC